MNNFKKTLDSGSVLEVTMSPFIVGNRLFKAIAKEIQSVDISIGAKGSTVQDIFQLEVSDQAINTVKNIISRLLSSDSVEEVLWQCMERATYNGVKISADVFESEKARGDYFIVAKEVLWFNLSPFVRNLGSLFREIKGSRTDIQKS